ncbi:MAG: glycosyl hydrolase family 28-related protein [Mangrovibacterium sp.]
MKKLICILIFLSYLMPVRGQEPSFPEPVWQIKTSGYPTNSTIIAGYSVSDFGAKGDGVTDDSKAFQKAMNAMNHYGGGVVFVPEGKYLITEPLLIYENITLRGEWKAPDENGIHGTLLMVKTGKGNEQAKAFITLQRCAGVKELNIWYPEQDPQKVVAYPWCIHQPGEENATVENVTLVNPYLGIRIGDRDNALHYIHHVYGTPLKTGLLFDRCFDIGRLEGIHFNPDVWSNSRLPGAPRREDVLSCTLKNGTALVMYRSDWEYGYDIRAEGYRVGFEISGSPRLNLESGAPEAYPNAQFYGFELTNCEKAVLVEGANPYGIAFTRSRFQGKKVGFEAAETFNSVIQFHDCSFMGQQALKNNGNGHFALQHCRIDQGEVMLFDGSVTILDTEISEDVPSVYLAAPVQQAELLGNRISPSCKLVYDRGNSRIKTGPAPSPFRRLPDFKPAADKNCRPGKEKLYLITGAPYHADKYGEKDCAPAIQKAIDDASADGGGIVFFPAGDYKVHGNLVLKEGVELRGISEGPHHTVSAGTVLYICTGKGKEKEANPFIRMKSRSGIQGLCFHYPDQNYYQISPYPFMIRGEGDHLYLVNISATNPYRMIDLATHRCDDHYLSYVAGSPLSAGFQVGGGSSNGCIKNTQFNPHYWAFTKFDNAPRYGADKASVWNYQNKNLDAMILGDVNGQVMFQNFVFGSLYGIHLIEEHGRGPAGYIHGHGSDGAEISAYIQGVGKGGVEFVNTQLVTVLANKHFYIHFDPGEGKSLGFYNTLFWGTPVESVLLKSGHLDVQLANFHKTGRFGFQVAGGDLYLANAYFWNPSRFIRVWPGINPPVLIGNLYRSPKRKFPLELEIRDLPVKPPLPEIHLSEIDYIKASDQLSEHPKKNRSIRDNPLTIAGKQYEHGLGVHADSEVIYAVKPGFERFVAIAGIDDEIMKRRNYRNTMVIFQVWTDDRLAAESPEMTMEENRIWHFDVPLPAGTKTITLKVTGFGGIDHADWVDAGFITKK